MKIIFKPCCLAESPTNRTLLKLKGNGSVEARWIPHNISTNMLLTYYAEVRKNRTVLAFEVQVLPPQRKRKMRVTGTIKFKLSEKHTKICAIML